MVGGETRRAPKRCGLQIIQAIARNTTRQPMQPARKQAGRRRAHRDVATHTGTCVRTTLAATQPRQHLATWARTQCSARARRAAAHCQLLRAARPAPQRRAQKRAHRGGGMQTGPGFDTHVSWDRTFRALTFTAPLANRAFSAGKLSCSTAANSSSVWQCGSYTRHTARRRGSGRAALSTTSTAPTTTAAVARTSFHAATCVIQHPIGE